jgi:hypothetical protein
MKDKILLTIGRQYGSGGHEIGQRLSQMLNIGLYDKEILKESAKQSGLDDKIFEISSREPLITITIQRKNGEVQTAATCA